MMRANNQNSEEPNNSSQLIDLVDRKFKSKYRKLLLTRLPYTVYTKFILILGSIVGFIIIAMLLIRILNILPSISETATLEQTISVFLAITALFVSIVLFPFSTLGTIKSISLFDVLVHCNYNALKKEVTSEDLHHKLMALVILKSKHPNFPESIVKRIIKRFYFLYLRWL
jgi:hypothetical protein